LPSGPGKEGTFTFVSNQTDVVKFRYGWSNPPTAEVASTVAGSNRTATVKVTAPKFGENILWVQAINSVGTPGNHASRSFTVDRPSPPIASYGLEKHPAALTDTQAFEDRQPALAGDSDLLASNVSWAQDSRLVGGQTVKIGGTTTLSTATSVVDTTKSFSVAGWYKIGATMGHHVLVSQESTNASGFSLVYFGPYSTWNFMMWGADSSSSDAFALSSATEWTHVAGVYDAPANEIRLYINGNLAGTGAFTAPMSTNGPLHIGRGKFTPTDWGTGSGEAADVQIFNRVLVPEDFHGKLASASSSGIFNEPGILTPIGVGDWDFEAATACYEANGEENTCEAPDSSMWSRRLRLTTGSNVDGGHRGNALKLDAVHWADDPSDPHYGQATEEQAMSQRNTAPSGQPAQWEDAPVLITNQSYTVSVWAYKTASSGGSVVGQLGGTSMAFSIGHDDWWNRWAMSTGEVPGTENTGNSTWSYEAPALDQWVHLVGVYDHSTRTIKIYVNGQLQTSSGVANPWNATGPLTLGLGIWRGFPVWRFNGGIDDLTVFQGAMTEAAVKNLYDNQQS
jgi:hypothetical protein